MGPQHGFSRRQMLATMIAAGSAAAGYRPAAAQAAKRIERLDPALDEIISTSEPIVDIATNLGGTANVEGPLWWKEGGYLLFRGTDLKRWKYSPGQPISVFKEKTNAANGLTRDPQGRLVACEAATRRVVREEHDGSITVMASTFQGRPLNFPNDVVVKSDGAIYFTDPWAGPRAGAAGGGDLGHRRRLPHLAGPGNAHAAGQRFPQSERYSVLPDRFRLSTSTTRRAGTFAPSTCCRTARSPAQPTACWSPLRRPSRRPDGMKVDSAGNRTLFH